MRELDMDDLLKDAKRQRHLARLRAQQEAARLKAQEPPQPILPERPHYQLEAAGWYAARTILIVKENPDHSLTPLGVYIEHLHPVHGRHLVPCPSLDSARDSEIVSSWGDPRPRPAPVVETDEEITEIRNRFYSLLAELDEEDEESSSR